MGAKNCKYAEFSFGTICQIHRPTHEALIAEKAVWPKFLLMNVFFALKGSKLFIIIYLNLKQSVLAGSYTSLLIEKHLKFWQSSFIYTLSRSVSLLTSALNFQTIIAGARHMVISRYFCLLCNVLRAIC